MEYINDIRPDYISKHFLQFVIPVHSHINSAIILTIFKINNGVDSVEYV